MEQKKCNTPSMDRNRLNHAFREGTPDTPERFEAAWWAGTCLLQDHFLQSKHHGTPAAWLTAQGCDGRVQQWSHGVTGELTVLQRCRWWPFTAIDVIGGSLHHPPMQYFLNKGQQSIRKEHICDGNQKLKSIHLYPLCN